MTIDPLITIFLCILGVGIVIGIILPVGLALEQVKTHDLTIVGGQAAWVERGVEDDRAVSA